MVLAFLTATSAAWANPNGVAVIIGNQKYADKDIPDVDFAHRDSEAMLRFVRDVLGYREENILILKDASQAQMESAFGRKGNHRGRAFQYVRPGQSDLMVFYSGHGVPGRTDGRSYLLPTDAALTTSDINGYPLNVLYENLAKAGAKSVTVFLDACFSGGSHNGPLIKGASGIQVLPEEKSESAQDNQGSEITVVTAAGQDQLASWDEEAKHGLFTEYLLRALYGQADGGRWGDGNGKVTLGEVRNFLNDEMRYRARRAYNREQTPTVVGHPEKVLAAAEGKAFPERPAIEQPLSPAVPVKSIELTPMETERVALENANVRALPSVASAKIGMVKKGAIVAVPGKVVDQPWLAIEKDGEIWGYVYEALLGDPGQLAEAQKKQETAQKLDRRLSELEDKVANQPKEPEGYRPPPPPPPREERIAVRRFPGSDRDRYRPSAPRDRRERIAFARQRLTTLLGQMGRLLQNQSYLKRVKAPIICPDGSRCIIDAISSLSYNEVQPRPNKCSLKIKASFEHDRKIERNGKRKGVNVKNRKGDLKFWGPQTRDSKTMAIKSHQGRKLYEVTHYLYGKARFTSREDRNQFASMAEEVSRLCRGPGVIKDRRSRR